MKVRKSAAKLCHGSVAMLCLLVCPPSPAAADVPDSWFQTTTQALFDAVAVGDKPVWDRVLDADCMITTEDGEVQDRAKFMEELRPLPQGFSGQIRVRGLTVRRISSAAVVHYWIDEVENIFDQQLHTTYVETDMYQRVGQSWKIVAMHVTVVPRDLEPIDANPSGWQSLLGNYRYSEQATSKYQVFMRDGALYGGRDPKSATQLIPLAPLVFYQKASIHIMVFVPDKNGAVNEVRELHKYNEVRMKRAADARS
jgi:hypothetical protein